jgi:hypothetical protein
MDAIIEDVRLGSDLAAIGAVETSTGGDTTRFELLFGRDFSNRFDDLWRRKKSSTTRSP